MKDYAERHGASPKAWPVLRWLAGRRFDRSAQAKVLILFEQRRIAFTTVYPFLMYARAFADRFGASIRLLPTEAALRHGIPNRFRDATHVIVQTWLTDPPGRLEAVWARLDALDPQVRRIYLDSFANSDIRFAARLPDADLYYKKSLLKNPDDLTRPLRGHTTQHEYYGDLFGVRQEDADWGVPASFLPRLRLAPNFLTGPDLAPLFAPDAPLPAPQAARDIDLNARLGGTGHPGTYGEMRRQAEARALAMRDLRLVHGTGVPAAQFMNEMRRARLCFSPFGHGELCWRDIESFATGAVLLKPDMSHLATAPDLYRDNETYVALNWDFSDLEEKVRALLADPERADRIARTAFEACRDYLAQDGPVETYAEIFANT